MKKVTIQDIAEQTRLSRNTVAKALNDGAVSYETKMSVLQAAYEMGYAKLTEEHMEALRSVRSEKNTRAVLVLSGRSQEQFWNQILTGISDTLSSRGYRMLLHIVDEQELAGNDIGNILAPDVDGVISLSVFPIAFVEAVAQSGLPIAFFDAPQLPGKYLEYGDVIYSEGWFAMERMVQSLIGQGYREFGFMGYPEGTKSIHDRFDGYRSALQKNGITQKERFCYTGKVAGDYYDYRIVEQLVMEMDSYPEVFVCANDVVAKNIASALHKKDPQKEESLVLVGFDHTVEAGFFRQDIYSVDVNKEDLGRRLAKSVLDQITERMEHALITVRTYPDL